MLRASGEQCLSSPTTASGRLCLRTTAGSAPRYPSPGRRQVPGSALRGTPRGRPRSSGLSLLPDEARGQGRRVSDTVRGGGLAATCRGGRAPFTGAGAHPCRSPARLRARSRATRREPSPRRRAIRPGPLRRDPQATGPAQRIGRRLMTCPVGGGHHARLALTHSNVGAHDAEACRSAHRAIDAAMRSGRRRDLRPGALRAEHRKLLVGARRGSRRRSPGGWLLDARVSADGSVRRTGSWA